jgi:hypothetical protein
LPAALHGPLLYVGQNKEAILMRKIYVSDSGDDKGDGLTEKTPIRSWQRFIQLCEAMTKSLLWGTAAQGR